MDLRSTNNFHFGDDLRGNLHTRHTTIEKRRQLTLLIWNDGNLPPTENHAAASENKNS